MSRTKSARTQDHFADLTDPRRREVRYPLINIVVIAICAVICGADDFAAIAEFGRLRRDWGVDCSVSNIHRVAINPTNPNPAVKEHCIKITSGCSLVGAKINGFNGISIVTAAKGILAGGTTPKVIGCEVKNLAANFSGIESTSSNAVIADNAVYGLSGTGVPYLLASGVLARNNFGYASITTAAMGAATLHAESGVIISEPLSTAPGLTYTLLITNQLVSTGSRIHVSVSRDTEADSLSYQVQEVIPQSGSFWVVIKNTGSVPFGDSATGPGTIKISFTVQN